MYPRLKRIKERKHGAKNHQQRTQTRVSHSGGSPLLNKIQFNSLYINMWLSSLNIFEENQFYEIKKEKLLTQLIRD